MYLKEYTTKTLIVLDPLTGFNASKSAYLINDIQKAFNQTDLWLTALKTKYENGSVKFFNSVNYIFGIDKANQAFN